MREKRLTFLSVPISGNGIFNNYLKINDSAAPCAVDMKTLKKLSTARVLRHL